MNVKDELIDRLIDLAFAEDIGDGDHTTLSTVPADAMGKNMLLIKEDGVLAGVDMAKALNIAPKTFYAKMKSGKFGPDEAEIMIDVLEIPNPTEIFFAKV